MAWFTDSLRGAIDAASRFSPFQRGPVGTPGVFSHQMALAAYMSSGMLKKVISIPAEDRVREWRDWQADADAITKIETEEKRLDLQAKVQQAEVLRGVGGGAIVIITAGDHASELKPDTVRTGGIVALNVVSRWQIHPRDIGSDLASPDYGLPAYFEVDNGSGKQTRIHPSRVICFRGAPLPAGSSVDDVEIFWGDSRLLRVFNEVTRSDETQAWFAALVRKAKLTRIGIPDLDNRDQEQLAKRVSLIAQGESALNATLYRSSSGSEDPGETITDYQITWAGIPAVMDAFDQRVAAVSDIPFTRLMGRSPAGMNATGKADDDNWNKMVVSGQKLETRPCLEKLDAALLRSAGVDPAEITWKFAPLSVPSEKEEADTFKITMEAVEKLQATGAIPDEAFAKGIQNLMTEREYIPGLDQALSEIPEAERFGLNPEDDGTDPSALQAGKEGDPASAGDGGSIGSGSPRRAANDAKPVPLYVQRKLLNAADLIKWAKAQGFTSTLPADDMHVTILYSRTPVDPLKMGEGWGNDEDGNLIVRAGGPRAIERLGENAVVLSFASWSMIARHDDMVRNGASHDWPEYTPHVTISYAIPEGTDLDAIKPFTGELRFGPEEFSPLDLDWKSKITEDGGSRTSGRPFDDARIYRRDKRGRFASSIGSAASISKFLGTALKVPGDHHSLDIGTAGGKSPANVHGYARRLHSGTVAHALNQHGNRQREASRGQLPLTRSDIAKVPKVIDQAHTVTVRGTTGGGRAQSISYTAKLGKREYTYVETVGTKRQQVVFKTMWKR